MCRLSQCSEPSLHEIRAYVALDKPEAAERLTRAGRRQVEKEARNWEQATQILARFLAPKEELS
ncbi:MAG: hypothetical protein ACRD3O_18810 [Terriglobia bacterium]